MNKMVTKLFGSEKVMKAKKIEYEFKTEEFSEDFFSLGIDLIGFFSEHTYE